MSLFKQTASNTIEQLRTGQVTPLNLLDVLENRIRDLESTNVNALPFALRNFERARKEAKAIVPILEHYRKHPKQVPIGYLWGLPIIVKDTVPVVGFPFTQGSLMLGLKNRPETSHPLATLIRKKGGIIYAKSNVPEFAAGSNTFNPLFGITASPYDTTRTAGGSSGGSAAALCCGMGFLATGSDLGGSLRIPASFCGVVGLRPSFGLIPGDSAPYGQLHALNGPMGRNVLDTAILMDAMCLARSDNKTYQSFVTKSRTRSSQRLIFSKDVGGTCHGMMDPEIVDMCRDVAHTVLHALRGRATPLDETSMTQIFTNTSDASMLFEKLRALNMYESFNKKDLDRQDVSNKLLHNMAATRIKPEFVWNTMMGSQYIFHGKNSVVQDVHQEHQELLNNVTDFFEQRKGCDTYILTPTTCSVPFDKHIRYLTTTPNGTGPLRSYVEWLRPTYVTTLLNCPVISIPIGVTESGLPIGMSIIAKHGNDGELLQFAGWVETLLNVQQGSGVVLNPVTIKKINCDDTVLNGPKSRQEARDHHSKLVKEMINKSIGEEPNYSDPQGYSLKTKTSSL